MKKWMYAISVSSMLIIFLVLYFAESNKIEERERAKNAEIEKAKVAEDARRAEIEARAHADADKRAKEKAAEEAKKEADHLARYLEDGRKLQEITDKYVSEADASAKKAADLEIQLTTLRAAKEKLNRESFELAKQVELGKINRRTAELEIQRTVEIISRKAAESSMTRVPAVVAAPAPSS